jgi:hypothetical protein
MNMHTFTTELLGPKAEVEGVFYPGESETVDCPGEGPSFEIEQITINDVAFEIDCLCDETLKQLEDEAFDDVTANQEPF